MVRRLLQAREVEARDRLFDQLLVALRVERPPDDSRGRLEREVGDLGADLLERARGLGRDLLARLLEPTLPLGLGLLAHPLLHRLAGLARLGQDRLALAPCLGDQLLVLLEQPLRLVSRPSAASIECRIDSCRWSIIFWIGPNAYRLSTKSAIRKQTIVQIISPGVTEMSGFDARIT